MNKTNAMRLLDKAKIQYRTKEFEVIGDNYFGVQVAENFNMAADQVIKTLVTTGDKNGINIFCIPINCELNLKKAAVVSKNKKIEMVKTKEILSLTGYIRGGCSPIGMKKNYPTFIDEITLLFDSIGVSAGARGCEIIINPVDLATYINAEFHSLT